MQQKKGGTKQASAQRKVQLASRTELKKWADIGPRSVAAAAGCKQPATEKESEVKSGAPPTSARNQRGG